MTDISDSVRGEKKQWEKEEVLRVIFFFSFSSRTLYLHIITLIIYYISTFICADCVFWMYKQKKLQMFPVGSVKL